MRPGWLRPILLLAAGFAAGRVTSTLSLKIQLVDHNSGVSAVDIDPPISAAERSPRLAGSFDTLARARRIRATQATVVAVKQHASHATTTLPGQQPRGSLRKKGIEEVRSQTPVPTGATTADRRSQQTRGATQTQLNSSDCRRNWSAACEERYHAIHERILQEEADKVVAGRTHSHFRNMTKGTRTTPGMQKTVGSSRSTEASILVVGSLTTTPPRIQLLNETLASLVAQTRPLDAILVVIPFASSRLNKTYEIPGWLQSYGHGVTIIRTQEDWGPASKLVPTIGISLQPNAPAGFGDWLTSSSYARGEIQTTTGSLARLDGRTRIITFDDDRIYKPWLVEMYTLVSLNYPDVIIGADSHNLNTRGYTSDPMRCEIALGGGRTYSQQPLPLELKSSQPVWTAESDMPLSEFVQSTGVDLLLGCGAVMYQPRLLDVMMLTDFAMMKKNCFHVDDVFFASASSHNLSWSITCALQTVLS